MMHIRLCDNINNRLSIGGLTLYCTSNNQNIDSVRTKGQNNRDMLVHSEDCIYC